MTGAVVCAHDDRERSAGRDVMCARLPTPASPGRVPMSRFIAPLTFTVAAAWVVVLFVLAHSTP